MSLTRRDATKLVLTGPALALAPLPALARSKQEWAAILQQELNNHLLPGCDGTLSLRAFDMRTPGNTVQMAALVHLNWAPGERRHRFDSFGDREDAAFKSLLNQALFKFAKAWPGCVV